MTRDEIIKLARDSGAAVRAGKWPGVVVYEGGDGITLEVLERAVLSAVAAEREACATVCDRYGSSYFAAKIRERSNVELRGERSESLSNGGLAVEDEK